MNNHLPKTTLPMTQSQKLIWAGQSLADQSPLYNMVWRFDLHLALNPEVFAEAFKAVFQYSDALGTVFLSTGNDIKQYQLDHLSSFANVLDFSGEADPETTASTWIEARAKQSIDLSRSTFDTRLIKLGDTHWIWFLNQHHIATDAWSGSLVFKSVSTAYQAILSGGQYTPSELASFKTYAKQENSAQTDGSLTTALEYWAKTAAKLPLSTAPYGCSRNLSVSASQRKSVNFGVDRTAALKSLALSDGFKSISSDLSIFALLATAYAGYLYRVTGQTTVAIGTPSHNRATPDLKATPGLFIEMFPLRIEIEHEETFSTLYRKVLAEIMNFLRHAKPGASTAATSTVFNTVLNYIPVSYGKFANAETTIKWIHPNAHDARHDMRLHVYDFEDSGEFTVEFDFNCAVFNEELISRAPIHFLAMVDALLANPSKIISMTPLLNPCSNEIAVSLQSDSKFCGPSGSVLDRFAEHVSAAPRSIAVECEGQTISYAELDMLSNSFAAKLATLNVTTGTPVLLNAKRSIKLVAALLGILKAGGFFVPVSSETPIKRQQDIIRLAQPVCIVIDETTATKQSKTEIPRLNLDDPVRMQDFTLVQQETDATAYTIFTSGSTGEPKGVAVGHDGLADYIRWAGGTFGAPGPKTYPLYSSIAFDLTLTSLFVPLTTGGTIVVYPETGRASDLSILEVFKQDQVDVVKLTPSHLALLCEQSPDVRRIKTLVLGGENLTTDLSRRALDRISPDLEIINEYGPTEAVVGCMIYRFDPKRDRDVSVPIGRSADNTKIYILDAGLNPVPIGVTGEIFIGGTRLAKGYLRRKDLTAEKFIADPFEPGQRLYRSGDLARARQDGNIDYLGRADNQVKINGVRIEPAEVEDALKSVSGVENTFITTFQKKSRTPSAKPVLCLRCGISSDFPETTIGSDGICGICHQFEGYKDRANAYFKTPEALHKIVTDLPKRKRSIYDAIVLLSGGKDSTYALYRFADLTKNILALTLDNGYISEGAKINIKRVTDSLGIDHQFMTTPAMNTIFNDSLSLHSNVCQGCFKTIYSLALKMARDEGIPAIVTGLSRGQFFETRLTPELFENRAPTPMELEDFVLEARKSYHRMEDEVSRNLCTEGMFDDQLFEDIEFIDIYRYIDVHVQEIYDFLLNKAPWIRPGDTGRSTNCLINDAGIYVHKRREGFHNYSLPYSWDVRMGHKTRDDAVEELNDEIDIGKVHEILREVGFDEQLLEEETQRQLVSYCVVDQETTESHIRSELASRLLPAMIPAYIILLDELPLTANGKIDESKLPKPDIHRPAIAQIHVGPSNEREAKLVDIYKNILGTERVGVTDNFYDIGGDSIAAIQIAILASEYDIAMEPNAIFEYQTIRELAENSSIIQSAEPTQPHNEPLIDLGATDLAALSKQLSGLE